MSRTSSETFLGVLVGFACTLVLFSRRPKKPPVDDAEVLLQEAQQQMREAQARNREHAVQAITQKNNLQALVNQTQERVSRLEERAELARQEGDTEREQDILAERGQYLLTLSRTQASLQQAIETAEAIKTAMRREEERIRAETARALAMKAQFKQLQIELAIEKSRLAMTTTTAAELFTRAQAKIQQAQARRNLMTQIRQTVEALETAAQEGAVRGDDATSRVLLIECDKLKMKALDPHLW